jgi:diacylglycerol kinase (ATP)
MIINEVFNTIERIFMKNYKIIVNPISGRGTGESSIPKIQQRMQDHKLPFDLVRTERPWHAAELATQAVKEGFDVVVAVGGDGTSNEVINGLMSAKETGLGESILGLICVGRGNDFAYGVGVPRDLDEACLTLAQQHVLSIDIGRVTGGLYPNGRYFGNGVGIGFDAVVGFEALKMKHLSGFVSYMVAALKTTFLYFKAPKVCIEYDSQRLELFALMISVMNGKRMGGGFMMAPNAHVNDSLFDLCVASQVSKARIFALIPLFMKGTQASHPAIQTFQTRYLKVRALEGSLPAHADGETLCIEGKELSIEILPRQIGILIPHTEDGK